MSREGCDVVRPMLPRAVIVHHDYQQWLAFMWYAWRYMAKDERRLEYQDRGHVHYHALLYSANIDEICHPKRI